LKEGREHTNFLFIISTKKPTGKIRAQRFSDYPRYSEARNRIAGSKRMLDN
jgi:hypothetical protein